MNTNEKIYDRINQIIFEKLEQGVIPWKATWHKNQRSAMNLISKKPYQGINSTILNLSSFPSPYFVTFRQAQELGGTIKKGERGLPVVFWKIFESNNLDETKTKTIPLLRYYTVFNVTQCEGLSDHVPNDEAFTRPFSPIEAAEKIVADMPNRPQITHGQGRAYYQPSTDIVNMPDKDTFFSDTDYYSVLFHEMGGHATGHQSRLNRTTVTNATLYNRHEYSKEELIAEFTASYLCAHAGIEQGTIENSAAYIGGWLKALKNNKSWLIMAASQAQKAVNYIVKDGIN